MITFLIFSAAIVVGVVVFSCNLLGTISEAICSANEGDFFEENF